MGWYIFFGILILIGGYVACSFTEVKQNERVLRCLFGKAISMANPGLAFTPLGLITLVKFPTKRQELQFETTIMTQEERDDDNKLIHSATEATVKLSFRWQWPSTYRGMVDAYEMLGDPADREHLHDLLEEPVVDGAETAAATMSWRQLYERRQAFTNAATGHIAGLRLITGSGLNRPRVILTEVILDEELTKALIKPEIAAREAEATANKARGEAEATRTKAEAEADRVGAVYAAIAGDDYQDKGADLRKVEAMEKLAEGPGNVVISLPEVSEALTSAKPIIDRLTGGRGGGRGGRGGTT